jgi:CDP-paratose 2-epimerase
MKPAVVLVTGGAGFVGSSLAIHLAARDRSVRVIALDNLKRRGSELNLPRLRAAGVEFVHGDIRNPEDLEIDVPPDLVLECSAEPSVLAGYDSSPAYVLQTNLVGTLHVLELCRRSRASLLFLSTSRVYPIHALERIRLDETATRYEIAAIQDVLEGLSPRGIGERFPLDGARSLYGATKLASELFIEEYAHAYGVQAIVNRCGVIAGPWQMGKVDQGVLALWVARHVYGGDLAYIGFGGTGKQVRDLLHIDDLCDLVSLQIDRFGELAGDVYNVGGGREGSVSLLELTDLCEQATGNRIPIRAIPETRQADIPLYLTDTTKLVNATGWAPQRSIEALVTDTVQWIRSHEDELRPILHPQPARN